MSPLDAFRWQDGERLIVFGRGAAGQAAGALQEPYVLLTTERARSARPELAAGAQEVHEVPAGRVDELADALRGRLPAERLLVALGGGRIIDVAKALAAADPPRRVAAVPTTLSGAEMTAIHRHASGVDPQTPRVRPALVINDPALSSSQPLPHLAASAANALGHAIEGPLTSLANPVATLAGQEAVRLIARGVAGAPEAVDHDALALGALLAGYVIGSTGYGLHHVLSQTLARFGGLAHGSANAIMLAHSLRALERRFPSRSDALASATGEDPVGLAERLARLSGVRNLSQAGLAEEALERRAQEASRRAELALTPPAADVEELRGLLRQAYAPPGG